MLSQLPPLEASVSGRFFVLRSIRVLAVTGNGMVLVELLCSIRTLEFMALTGNAGQRNSHDQQGK